MVVVVVVVARGCRGARAVDAVGVMGRGDVMILVAFAFARARGWCAWACLCEKGIVCDGARVCAFAATRRCASSTTRSSSQSPTTASSSAAVAVCQSRSTMRIQT